MRGRRALVAVALPVLCIGVLARPAAGQVVVPGYPGPTTTVPGEPTSDDQNAGTVRAGQTIVVESCGFAASEDAPEVVVSAGDVEVAVELTPEPVTEVAVTWNDQPTGTATTGDDGCASVPITVHERTDSPPCPASTVNDQERPGERGRNDLVVSGEGANGAPRTVSTRVSISCSNGNGNGGGGGGLTTGSSGGGEATEADADPGVRVIVDLGDSALISATRQPLVRWSGLSILGLGVVAAFVLRERRRRIRRSSFAN